MQPARVIVFDLFGEILHGNPCALFIRIGKQHGELVPAKTHQQIRFTERGAHQLRHGLQRLIPLFMPVAIVDLLEAIQIQPAERQRLGPASGDRKREPNQLIKAPAVE